MRFCHLVFVCALVGCLVLSSNAGHIPTALEETTTAESPLFYDSPTTGIVQGPISGTNLNDFVGASFLYGLGYDGTDATVANIEAGHVWSDHETLGHVNQMVNQSGVSGEVDRHATGTSFVMAGRPTASAEHQRGIAYNADLWSGAVATSWSGTPYALSFSISSSSYFNTYRDAMQTGLDGGVLTKTADIISNSYSLGGDETATTSFAIGIDAFANQNPETLLVYSAGNSGGGNTSNSVSGPSAGYNVLTVGALDDNGGFVNPSSFSSFGPSDYEDPTQFVAAATAKRTTVDIAAPGEHIGVAYYGGQTGGNNVASLGGSANGPAGGSDFYDGFVAGTSYSAPVVAGGAALLYDVSYDVFATNDFARDARVMKAILMNSADKTNGWDNGQVAHANGNGGVETDQSLDYRTGAGRMNLETAYTNYTQGTSDVAGTTTGDLGLVETTGWDYGLVTQGTDNRYNIQERLAGGTTMTATLTWFRDRSITILNTTSDNSFDNLDLEIWMSDALGGSLTELISVSFSTYNETEHLSFTLPETGYYAIVVEWDSEIFDVGNDVNAENYALAWTSVAIPEPASLLLSVAGMTFVVIRRRRA